MQHTASDMQHAACCMLHASRSRQARFRLPAPLRTTKLPAHGPPLGHPDHPRHLGSHILRVSRKSDPLPPRPPVGPPSLGQSSALLPASRLSHLESRLLLLGSRLSLVALAPGSEKGTPSVSESGWTGVARSTKEPSSSVLGARSPPSHLVEFLQLRQEGARRAARSQPPREPPKEPPMEPPKGPAP
jgi:hypothetical protein